MDTLIGLVGDGYTLIAADASAARSIMVFKTNEDKIMQLDSHKLMAAAGTVGDRYNFCEYIQKNIHLHELRTTVKLDTKAAANFTRLQLANALRRGPYQVNLLMGGYDEGKGPSLFFLDYLGAMHQTPTASHGYGSNFVLSTLDRYWRKGLSLEEGVDIIKKCIHELDTRFLLHNPKWVVKVADKDGTRVVEL